MSGITDTATVTLSVNGSQAKQMMSELESKIKQTEDRIASLKAKMADPKDIEKARKQLRNYQKQLGDMQSATEGVKRAFENLDKATPRQLEKTLRTLNKQLRDMTPGSEVWNSHVQKIKELKERLSAVRNELKVQESWWSRAVGWVNKWQTIIVGAIAGSSSVIDVFRSSVDAFASMDQEMANVRKFTGMSADEVTALNDEFKKIDTRSSREELNKLAQEAGRLGKNSPEDVLGFVKAADKINVALDDLGDGATLTLSKLTGIFGDEARYGTEQSLLKVGSVINELSQNCSASAPYLAEFASRLGGVGSQAGMSIQQIMGFGAVLDSNAQKVEASATALSQIIVRLYQEPAKYAKVAGLDVAKFSKLMREDANAALILFLETLQKSGGMDVLSPMFKDMGENGSRAIAALSTLATHIDQVKAQQAAANVAFEEGTSIDKEFAVQNDTVQASLEKAKNRANELRVELGEKLAPVMKHLLTSGSALMRAMLTSINFVVEHKNAIILLSLSIASCVLYTKGYAIATTVAAQATKTWAAVTAAFSRIAPVFKLAVAMAVNAVQYFTNGLQVNYAMQLRWRKAIASLSFTGWVSAIMIVVGALYALSQRTKEAMEWQKKLNDVKERAAVKLEQERSRLAALIKVAQDETVTMKDRLAATEELNRTIPKYNAQIDQTTGKYKASAKALKEYLTQLRNKLMLEGAQKIYKDLGRERAEAVIAQDAAQSAYDGLVGQGLPTTNFRATQFGTSYNYSQEAQLEAKKRLERATARVNAVDKKMAQIEKLFGTGIYDAGQSPAEPEEPVVSEPKKQYHSAKTAAADAKKAEAEKRKQDAAARREQAKAKKEFRDGLDAIKAARAKAEAEAVLAYRSGETDYLEYLTAKHAAEIRFYDDSKAFYEKHFADQKDTYLQDDKDYQDLCKKKEESESKFIDKWVALTQEGIKRQQAAEEREARYVFSTIKDKNVANEIALEEELLRIRTRSLDAQMELYNVGSKEYEALRLEKEKLIADAQYRQREIFNAKVAELESEYAKKSASERFKLEKATLDALLAAEAISLSKYEQLLEAIKRKYKPELPGDDGAQDGWSADDQTAFDKNKAELDRALADGLLSQEEYNEKLAALEQKKRDKMLAGIKQLGGEWLGMFANVGDAFWAFVDSLDGPIEIMLGKLSNLVSSTSAVVTAGMQMSADFAKAEAEIQIAAIERRYDREVQLAQGNSYKVRKLEKEKEAATAKVKNEANRKQFSMQIIQAIAQSIAAGLNAYASTLAIPIVGPVLAPAAMAVALAQGAVQVALLKKQQKASEAQGYSRGGFTKPGAVDEPAGIVHAGEWVASQKLLANPVARPMIEALDYAQRTNTIGSLRPDDVSRSITANNSLVRIAEGDGGAELLVAAVMQMSRTVGHLTERLNEPFVTVNTVTGDMGMKQAQDDYSRLMKNVTPRKYRK